MLEKVKSFLEHQAFNAIAAILVPVAAGALQAHGFKLDSNAVLAIIVGLLGLAGIKAGKDVVEAHHEGKLAVEQAKIDASLQAAKVNTGV